MGDHEGWAEPSGLLLSGLLPNEAASVTRALDMERWLKAEERTAELIACIQPNQPSEERRNAVADYVQRLIMKCFSCEVFTFTFGSVPLKTYLPDGDIDLTAFSMNQNLKDTWAQEVRDMLEKEEKSENAEFHVKEVQYIQAEVKIIKCLVENIVVDISFNQLGGLCTLCFLDEVDHLINQNHLFKRSIILIKAWCYYESRILGAHHGLISTYALETLVLYIFHVFNNSFAGPLEVLYRFLEFFSNFDWENFCVSLWGPVPISSLPEMTAEPPRRDNGELLLSRPFLEFCNLNYAVFPVGQENQGQPFASKHFNVVDPLRTNNNLGRSVSKGNFFRIRSAFAFGAKRLATLLECPKEKLITEIDMFFMNTWERHGGGHRPDAPSPDLRSPRPLNLLPDGVPENTRNHTAIKRKGENIRLTAAHKADGTVAFHGISSQIGDTTNHSPENMSRTSNMPTVSRTQSHTIYSNQNSRRISGQFTRDICSSETMHPEKDQRSSRQDYLVNEHEGQARCHFARTQSSPELANMNGEVLSRGNRKHGLQETGKKQFSSGRPDHSGRRKNMGSEASTSHSTRSSTDDPSSLRHSSSHQSLDTAAADSNSVSNSYNDDASGLGPIGEELASVTETTDVQQDMMHQEEQDLINMMASSRIHNFNGQVQVPLNFASAHLPVPVSPAVFASMGYAQRNLTGMVPATDIHLVERTWGSNTHFMQSLVSAPNPMPQYFPTGLASNSEEISESDNENSGLTELNQDGNGFWNEHEMGPSKGFDPDDGSFQMLQSNKQPLISSRASSSGSSVVRGQQKFVKDNKGPPREDHCYIPQYQNSIGNDYSDRNMNLRFLPVNANSSRSKPVSESSWDGSPMKASRSVRDKRGKKTGPAAVPPASYRKVKTGGWQPESPSSDHISSPVDDDNREWIPFSAMGSTEMAERSTRPLSVATLPVRDHQLSGYEPAQINESDSMMPIAPMLVGSSSRQRTMDNNGAMPFAFYQTGPPVPYLTMLPVYNFPIETGNTDGSTGHFDRDDGLESSSINQPDQNLNLADNLDQSEIFASSTGRVASVESVEQLKPKPDILNSDFLSHLRNLQYGRLCQTTRNHVPWMYPPSVMVPPVYLQGHFPWDGPGRPLMGNANLFTQLSPRLVPVAPLQPGFNRPVGVFQRFGDDLPRYRSGTGTYLPNPKVAFRDRHSSTKSHWGNYNYDKNDHGDRGGNWNFSSKSRPASRNHGRSQPEKPSSRSDRLMAADSRADRPWDSYRLEPMASYQAQNGSFSSANSMHSSANVSYGMYPIPPMDSNSVTPTGPAVPSVVMLYSYDNNGGYGSQAEQLEFGSLGPVHFSGMNEALQLGDSGPMHTMYEHRNSSYQGSSDRSSPDQPSSPQLQRSAAQRNYRLKDEDFPPLSFPDQGGNSGGISYSRKSSHYQTFFSNPSHS